MSFFAWRRPAFCVWPALPLPQGSLLWSAYHELDRTQWLSREEIQHHQRVQLDTLLRHAQQHVPYYRQVLSQVSGTGGDQQLPPLHELPILPRRVYQRRYAEFTAQQLPAGCTEIGRIHTSGASGSPVEVKQTNVVNLWWRAFYLRDLQWCGIDPRGVLAAVRSLPLSKLQKQQAMEGLSLPYWNKMLHQVLETGPSHGMHILQTPQKQLQWLARIQPHYLLSYPTNLDYLAALVEEVGSPLTQLRVIQAISERLDDPVAKRIERAFNTPVKNTYTCAEAGYLASPCPSSEGLHVHAENVILEVVDDQGRPCRPGETGRVLITTLHNFITPLIRYENDDLATFGVEVCPCGRGLPLLKKVEGKIRPMLPLPGGGAKSCIGLIKALRSVGGYYQHQIVQTAPDSVQLRITPCQGWSEEHAQRIRQAAADFYEAPLEIGLQLVDEIERLPGGKFEEIVTVTGSR